MSRVWRSILATGALAIGMLVLGVQSASAGEDLSGTWLLDVSTGMGNGEVTLVLEQAGDQLTGTYKGSFGEHPVKGAVKDSGFEVSFSAEQMGTTLEVKYAGKLEESKLTGTVNFGSMGDGTFTGKKQAASPKKD